MMKILLVNIKLRKESKQKLFPLGLGYIATALHNAKYDFDLLDFMIEDPDLEEYFSTNVYNVVCISSLVSGYKQVKEICQVIKKHSPRTIIIAGNSVASSIPYLLLDRTKIDIAVKGEGDETIVQLMDAINKNGMQGVADTAIHNICFRHDGGLTGMGAGKLIDPKNIIRLNYDLFNIDEYIKSSHYHIKGYNLQNIKALPVSSARGCVGRCTFCYHVFRGCKFRYRPAQEIVGEIGDMIDKYGLNFINLWDEITWFSKSQAKKLCQEIIKSGLKFTWMGRCRANLFQKDEDVEIIELMKEAGCAKVQFSLESGDEKILKAMNKKITVAQFKKQCELFKRANLTPITSLVIGYPQETPATIKKSIDVCINCGLYPSTGFLLPQPGSEAYLWALRGGHIKDEEQYLLEMGDRQDLLINMTQMSDQQLVDVTKKELDRCNKELGLDDKNDLLKTMGG